MGGSALPLTCSVICLGSPPHMMGWLNPPLNATPNTSFGVSFVAAGL
jgi:hypothetical protein